MYRFNEHLIEIHYQPKFSSTSGNIVGVEVLSRVYNENGLSVPIEWYIDDLNKRDVINQFTLVLLDNVIDELVKYRDDNVAFSINLFQNQLVDTKFIVDFISSASRYEGEITVELSEKDTNNSHEKILAFNMFRDAGISISLDDFGKCNSTIMELLTFKYDEVKIDQSILNVKKKDLMSDFITSLSNYFSNNDIRSVAEGIDSLDKLKIMKLSGVDHLQGFALSKPLSIHDLNMKFN